MIQRATENHDLCFMSRKSFKSPLRDICRFLWKTKTDRIKNKYRDTSLEKIKSPLH